MDFILIYSFSDTSSPSHITANGNKLNESFNISIDSIQRQNEVKER